MKGEGGGTKIGGAASPFAVRRWERRIKSDLSTRLGLSEVIMYDPTTRESPIIPWYEIVC